MSMIGEYLRVTPSELSRAIEDPQWALDHAEQIQDAQDENEQSPKEAKHFSTYKTWDMLGFLLRRFHFPVDVVHGEEDFADDEDWGYGPPHFLTVERVRHAARELARTSYDDLIRDVDHTELAAANVYPLSWDSPTSLEWARDYYGQLTAFFSAAADAGDAVLVWLD
ncbi:YfbM family protein [Actinospica robiniae]|uniref:DUF1877 domain-containing protein n=1 Tax=Actinospica robiniae DSM 44927 TaxID=479430 RepID=W9DZU7_9ACTN|nr:YfbM family protein [Actinospica robiniae]ETA71120.1 protein of unknown function (DUF1877) [Actinospica robiniae DSM 44927]